MYRLPLNPLSAAYPKTFLRRARNENTKNRLESFAAERHEFLVPSARAKCGTEAHAITARLCVPEVPVSDAHNQRAIEHKLVDSAGCDRVDVGEGAGGHCWEQYRGKLGQQWASKTRWRKRWPSTEQVSGEVYYVIEGSATLLMQGRTLWTHAKPRPNAWRKPCANRMVPGSEAPLPIKNPQVHELAEGGHEHHDHHSGGNRALVREN